MKYLNEIDLVEALVASRSLDVQDRNDILMVEVAQQLHLTESSQTEHGVVEGNNLLDRNLLTRGLVNRRAEPVSTSLQAHAIKKNTYQTTPYAPSPMISAISY